jgi:hypothetical protein
MKTHLNFLMTYFGSLAAKTSSSARILAPFAIKLINVYVAHMNKPMTNSAKCGAPSNILKIAGINNKKMEAAKASRSEFVTHRK